MAYGVYKKATEKSLDGKTYEYEILKEDYVGSVGLLLLNAPGGAVRWGQQGSDDLFEPVLPSSAELLLSGRESALAEEIRTSDEETFRLRIKENSNVFWVGKMTGDLIEGNLDLQLKSITLSAFDALGELENLGHVQTQRETLVVRIAKILKETGLDLNIRFASNWFTPAILSSEDPLNRIQVDGTIALSENGEQPSAYEALKTFLIRVGLQLKQSGGVWWVVQREVLGDDTFKYFEYDKDGNFVTSNAAYSPAVVIAADDTQYGKRLSGGRKPYRKAYKAVPVQFTPNLSFEQELGLLSNIEVTAVGGDIIDWTPVGMSPVFPESIKNNYYLPYVPQISDEAQVFPTGYIKQALQQVAKGPHKLRFTLNVEIVRNTSMTDGNHENANVIVYFAVKLGSYYLTKDGEDLAWTHENDLTANQEILDAGMDTAFHNVLAAPIVTPTIPAGGVLEVRIYRPVELSDIEFKEEPGVGIIRFDHFYSLGIRPKLAQVELLFGGVDEAEYVETIAEDIVKPNKIVRKPVEVVLGDGPTTLSPGRLTVDFNLTGDWKREPYSGENPTGKSIDAILAETLLKAQKAPVEIHDAVYTKRAAAGAVIEAHQVLVIGSQRFAPVYLERILQSGHSRGEWAEIRDDDFEILTSTETIVRDEDNRVRRTNQTFADNVNVGSQTFSNGLPGKGWRIYIDEDGNSHGVWDFVEGRKGMTFGSLVFKDVQVQGGELMITNVGPAIPRTIKNDVAGVEI